MATQPHPVSTDPLSALAATTAVRRLVLLAELELERAARPSGRPYRHQRCHVLPCKDCQQEAGDG